MWPLLIVLLQMFNILIFLIGISAPTIVGVDWRLDHSINSESTGRANVPMFYVALKVNDRGVFREINMIASLEQMQDLLSKV